MMRWMIRGITFIVGLLLAVQVVLVCLQVMGGGILSDAFTREISKYLMSWVALLGVVLIIEREGLLAISVWPQSWQRQHRLRIGLQCGIQLVFCMMLLWYGTINAWFTFRDEITTGGLGWPKVWVALALPVGMLLTVLVLVVRLRKELRE